MKTLDEIDIRFFTMVSNPNDIGTVGASDVSKTCDVCWEGKSRGRKKRMHLYIKDTYDCASIACFNCGYKANMYSYLKELHPNEFSLYKKEKQQSSFNSLKKDVFDEIKDEQEERFKINTSFMDSNIPDIPNTIDYESFKTNFILLIDTKEPLEYILNRGITPEKNWMYANDVKFTFNDNNINLKDSIIIPFIYQNGIYGFQALGWKHKRFLIYLVDGNQSWKVWNWFNIDKEKPVYIFESIYDALSSGLDNVISQMGATISNERLKELNEPIFCLDNFLCDSKAHEETLKYAKKGYKVFIWPEGSEKFKDTNDLRKIEVSYERISKMITTNIYQGPPAIVRLTLL